MSTPQPEIGQTRYNLSQFRKDRRESTPDNVFRISTILPNGMSYAEFALFYVLRSKKTGPATAATTTTRKTKTKRSKSGNESSDSGSPPLPMTRGQARSRTKGLGNTCNMEKIDEDLLSRQFRDVVGEPFEGISSFTVSKRRKKK